jgi:hypothetical protein
VRPASLRDGALVAWLLAFAPCAAWAGPPFLTDDPEPTETGHWEIYAPQVEAEGRGGAYDGSMGAELNYGLAPDVQLTVGLPVAYAHEAGAWRSGAGDLELSVKYRVFHDAKEGLSVAVFPGLTVPTAAHGLGARRMTAFLPVWAQRTAGPWTVFGGGGYALNPGRGNRNYWSGGLAISRQFSDQLTAGLEVDRQGADLDGGRASTSAGLGVIVPLKAPFRILASAGPTFTDGEASAGFHAFVALGLDF